MARHFWFRLVASASAWPLLGACANVQDLGEHGGTTGATTAESMGSGGDHSGRSEMGGGSATTSPGTSGGGTDSTPSAGEGASTEAVEDSGEAATSFAESDTSTTNTSTAAGSDGSDTTETASATAGEGTGTDTSGTFTDEGGASTDGTSSGSAGQGTTGAGTDSSGGDSSGGTSWGATTGEGTTGGDDAHVVYVDITNGLNGNDGSRDTPFRTLDWALDRATERGATELRIAEGLYEVDYENDSHVVVVDGISMYGGYALGDWDTRDPDAHPTVIAQVSPYVLGASRTVVVPDTVVSETVLDGLWLRGGSEYGVWETLYIEGDGAVVQNCILDGGVDATNTTSFAVVTVGSSPLIRNNRIWSGAGNRVVAIEVRDGGIPVITHNIIRADSSFWAYGFDVDGVSGATIVQNTIVSTNTAVRDVSTLFKEPVILENNIFSADQICVRDLSGPASLRNNNFDCPIFHKVGMSGQEITTLGALNSGFGGESADNVARDSNFVDRATDVHLVADASTYCDVSRGGLDASGIAGPLDADAVARTVPWTIGVYEYDGTCQ